MKLSNKPVTTKPSFSPTALEPVILGSNVNLQLNGINCVDIETCGDPCKKSITDAEAIVAGVPSSSVVYVSCNGIIRRRRLHKVLRTQNEKKFITSVQSVNVITKVVVLVPGGVANAQSLFTAINNNLIAGITSGLLSTSLHDASAKNGGSATSLASVGSVTTQLSDINVATVTPTSLPLIIAPTSRYLIILYLFIFNYCVKSHSRAISITLRSICPNMSFSPPNLSIRRLLSARQRLLSRQLL